MYLSLSQKKALAVAIQIRRRRKNPSRRVWVQRLLNRYAKGEFNLVRELRSHDDRFQAYFRLDRNQFDVVLEKIKPLITKMDIGFCRPISPDERLAICLRYLATGDSYSSIASSYRVGVSTVATIVPSVATAIWQSLVGEYMPVPKKEEWREIAREFQQRWNFPNCVGAIDGKHVLIQAPASSGSQFYNYKGTFSIVLLAVVDARYRFRVVDVGAYGRNSDGGSLAVSPFGKALQAGRLDLPEDLPLPSAEHLGPAPHVFVGDEAFPLRKDLLRPFPGCHLSRQQRIFNYRLSRARRIVENAFGILAAQWGMYHRVIGVSPENVDKLVKATVILHNFIRWSNATPAVQCHHPEPDRPTPAFQNIPRVGSNNAAATALSVREKYASYFSSPAGEVPWQHSLL